MRHHTARPHRALVQSLRHARGGDPVDAAWFYRRVVAAVENALAGRPRIEIIDQHGPLFERETTR